MFKILTVILLFFAVGVAMALLTRLTRIQQQIAERHKDLAENNAEMMRQRLEIERLSAALEAQKGERDIKS
jgi:cell division protein FtsB